MTSTSRRVLNTAVLLFALGLALSEAGAVTIDGIAATVNGEVITILELEKAGKLLLQEKMPTVQKREREKLKREILSEVLDQLVLRSLQRQSAASLGVRVNDPEVDKAIGRIMESNGLDEEMLERALLEEGMTKEEYRKQISDQILFSKLMQREVREKVTVTDEEVESYYEENKDEYFRPERIRVRHLLVKSSGSDGEAVQEARQEALAILEEFRGGADFDALVRQHSPETVIGEETVSNWLKKGEFLAELEEVAFALPQGQVSEPIRSQAGFHLIQVAAKEEGGHLSLAAVADTIREKLSRREMEDAYQSWLGSLRSESQIDIRY